MKNVLVISPTPPPKHGAAVATELLLRSAQQLEEFELHHLDNKYVSDVRDLSRFSLAKVKKLLRHLVSFCQRASREKFEAVVMTPTFYPKPFLKDSLFIWFAWLFKIPVRAAWLHMSFKTMGYEDRSVLMQWYVRKTFQRCTHFICVAQKLIDDLPDFMPPENRLAIANGVEREPEDQAAARSENSPLRVIYLSNIDTDKGWHVLFDVAMRLSAEKRERAIEFDFYGSPTKNTSAEEIEEAFASAPENISYRGFVDGAEKAVVYRSADIFCLPSFNEAFPLTVLEAMSYGLPVIASDVGAVSEALVHESGGLLVPPRDAAALESALKTLIQSPRKLQEMGGFNQRRYDEFFTAEAYVQRWKKAFDLMQHSS